MFWYYFYIITVYIIAEYANDIKQQDSLLAAWLFQCSILSSTPTLSLSNLTPFQPYPSLPTPSPSILLLSSTPFNLLPSSNPFTPYPCPLLTPIVLYPTPSSLLPHPHPATPCPYFNVRCRSITTCKHNHTNLLMVCCCTTKLFFEARLRATQMQKKSRINILRRRRRIRRIHRTGGSRLSRIFWEHENLSGLSIIRLIQLL